MFKENTDFIYIYKIFFDRSFILFTKIASIIGNKTIHVYVLNGSQAVLNVPVNLCSDALINCYYVYPLAFLLVTS